MPRKTPVECVCERCGETFHDRHWKPSRPTRFCSKVCAGAVRKTRVTLVCAQCGESFERRRYMADWSQERGPFCGFHCYALWQKANTRGTRNPNYEPISTARGSSEWMRNREVVMARDSRCCVDCGSTNHLHVHHREAWNPDDPQTHAPDNLETLCAVCHRRRHPLPRGLYGQFQTIR
jgi:hypothetical protein